MCVFFFLSLVIRAEISSGVIGLMKNELSEFGPIKSKKLLLEEGRSESNFVPIEPKKSLKASQISSSSVRVSSLTNNSRIFFLSLTPPNKSLKVDQIFLLFFLLFEKIFL